MVSEKEKGKKGKKEKKENSEKKGKKVGIGGKATLLRVRRASGRGEDPLSSAGTRIKGLVAPRIF